MPRKIDAGELLAGLGGLLVFVALFLDWFGGGTGWEVFEALDLVLLALALLAVWSAVSSVVGASSGLPPRALAVLGAVLLVIVVVQLIEPPPVFAGTDPVRDAGAWLALAGSALVLLGGVLRAASVSVTVSVGARDTRRRVPAVDRRPEGRPDAAPPRGSSLLADDRDQATQPFSALAGDPPAPDPDDPDARPPR